MNTQSVATDTNEATIARAEADAKARGAAKARTAETIRQEFGEGRYSSVMREAFDDAKRLLKWSDDKAEKFAKVLAVDLGRAAGPVKVGYGKVNKDGKFTLKEAMAVKGVTDTYAMSLGRLISKCNEINASKLAVVNGITLAAGTNLAAWAEGL